MAVIRAIEEHNPRFQVAGLADAEPLSVKIHYEPKMTVTFCDKSKPCDAASTSGGPEVQVGKLRNLVFYQRLKVGDVVEIHVRDYTKEYFDKRQGNDGYVGGGAFLLIMGLLVSIGLIYEKVKRRRS